MLYEKSLKYASAETFEKCKDINEEEARVGDRGMDEGGDSISRTDA